MTLKLFRGLVAGAAGTAAMTCHQELRKRVDRSTASPEQEEANTGEQSDPWDSAPAPAQVGKQLIEKVLGWSVKPKAIPVLTQVMHWSYGTLWGAVYAFGPSPSRGSARQVGPLFGLGVWAASYAQLVPAGIYEPPWKYSWGSLADEIGYHVTYGTTVALTYAMLDGRTPRFSLTARGRL